MDKIEKQVHLASQYLAAAGISFLNKEDDDSHTNLGFNTDGGYLETHSLSDNNDKLILNYNKFTLEWKSNKEEISFRLDGATHHTIVKWISETSKTFLNKEYKYNFHYNLPYSISDTYTFKLFDVGKLNELMHLRILAQFILEIIDNHYKLNTSIRTWPHHFDTGLYCEFPESDISIGLGLAIPDTICDEHYLYITGYKNGDVIDVSGLNKLSIGEWKSEEFMGAILNTNGIVESDGVEFFKQAINRLMTK